MLTIASLENDIFVLETIYTFLIIVLVSVVLPILIYCPIKFCADKLEKAQHKAYVKSHLKYIWFELYKKYGQDIGLARCFDNFCRTNSLHCFYKNGILFWQKEYTEKTGWAFLMLNGFGGGGDTYSKKWTSPVESHEIAQEILSNLLSMSLYDRLKIGIPKDYQLPKN